MIIKLNLPSNDDPALLNSPILKAAELTIEFIEEFGPIGLTNLKAFKRYFVTWAAKNFEWPYYSFEKLMMVNKVLNEFDFLPLEMLHFVLLGTKIGRHYKGAFHLTNLGKSLKQEPAKLWETLANFLIFRVDHHSYRSDRKRAEGNWHLFFNVINVEAQHGKSVKEIYNSIFIELDPSTDYHEEHYDFYFTVIQPLAWAGLITEIGEERQNLPDRIIFRNPLWQATLNLDTDDYLTETRSH